MAKRVGLVLGFSFVVLAALLAYRELTSFDAEDRDSQSASGLAGQEAGSDETTRLRGTGQESAATGAETGDGIDLGAVDRERDLHGLLRTPDGSPVAGAVLEAVEYPWTRRPADGDRQWLDTAVPGPAGEADGAGAFALRLCRGDRVGLRITAKGWAPLLVPGLSAGERTEIVMRYPVTLVVHLKDHLDRPVQDGRVRVTRSWYQGEAAVDVTVASGGEGRCVCEALPGGLDVVVQAESTTLGLVRPRRIKLPKRGETRLDLTFTEADTLTGRVTDRATGAPIEGAQVGVEMDLPGTVSTDAEGRYVLPGYHRVSPQLVVVAARGYVPMADTIPRTSPLDFQLAKGVRLTGRTVDSRGKPVPRAQVAVFGTREGEDYQSDRSYGFATTGTDGRFGMRDLLPDHEHAVVVLARGHGRYAGTVTPRALPGGVYDAGSITLPVSRRISGLLVEENGDGVAGHQVLLAGPNAESETPPPPGTVSFEGCTTDDLGRFAFVDLAPGHYVLSAYLGGGEKVVEAHDLSEDEDLDGVRLEVPNRDAYHVDVVGTDGTPVEGALVSFRVSGSDPRVVSARTDEKGVGIVEMAAPPFAVFVSVGGELRLRFRSARTRPWPSGARTLRIELPPEFTVHGCVLRPDGTPFSRAEVKVLRGEEVLRASWSKDNGTFAMPCGSAKPVVVEVTGRARVGGANVRLPFVALLSDVIPGASALEVFTRRVDSQRTLSFLVLDPEGLPVRGASVDIQPGLDGVSMPLVTDARGRATIEGLDPRPVSILVLPPAERREVWASARKTEVEAVGQEGVFRLEALIVLRGRVVGPDGGAAEGAEVHTWKAPAYHQTTTDDRGSFALPVNPSDLPVTLEAIHTPDPGTRLKGRAQGVGRETDPIVIRLARE